MPAVNRSTLLQNLPRYQGKEKIISQNQGVFDIMKEIGKAHSLFAADYEKISGFFDTGNIETTAKKLFTFCKANIKYAIESEEKQSTRSPSAIVAMGRDMGGDCKHYASFIAGVLDAIRRTTDQRINWAYRFSSYRFWDHTPHHVFVVITLKDKREIWVDPVLSYYDEKKLYTAAISKNFNTMPLVRMSGIENQVIGKTQKKIAKQAQKAADKKAGVKKPGILKKVVKIVKKVSIAPARNAFLALIGLNVHGMATKLAETLQDNARRAKLQNLWVTKLSGNFSNLESTIKKGAGKKKILGIDAETRIAGPGIGVIQVAAILAAAAPIIAAISEFLKAGTGADGAELDQATADAIETVKADVKENGTPQVLPAPELPTNTGQSVHRSGPSGADLMTAEERQTGAEPGEVAEKPIIPGVPNMALFAGAGLLLFMLAKK